MEFDPSPENSQVTPEQEKLERVNLSGIADVGTARGFLTAEIPALNLIVIGTHLKSSLGKTGEPDHKNAKKRELVAAAIATHVNELVEDFPQSTILVLGDVNVGVSDTNKNGTDLTVDTFSGPGDRYDETHALLQAGLIDGLEMRGLAEGLDGTFVGSDNTPDFAGAGAIDVIYVVGPASDEFSPAKRASDRFGSDHLAVFTTRTLQESSSHIVIKKLLPNPNGRDAGHETITLENTGTAITMNQWQFRDKAHNVYEIPDGTTVASGLTVIPLTTNSMPLNNNGDDIALFNDQGVQVGDTFSYTKSEVRAGQEIVR